jgi:outer membrane immunogenic protein
MTMDSARNTRPIAPTARRAAGLAACLLLTALAAGSARAADWLPDVPVLRGSLGAVNWEGFVVGGQMGVGNSDTDFGNSTHDMVAYALRNTTIESEQDPSGWTTLPSQIGHLTSYGGFVGYNTMWGQLVLGVEGAYNVVSSPGTSASDSIGRQFTTSDGFLNNVDIVASSSIKLNDYGTLRGRAGYAFGQFLPYATVGVAVGRFDYDVTAAVYADGTPTAGSSGAPFCLSGSYPNCTYVTQSDQKNDAIAAGLEVGLGMDVALTPNIFLRGEWEFIAFAPIHGINYNMNTARAGVGVKF